MLKDYPEHVERIQAYLSNYLSKPPKVTPLFEQAIWALEGCLDMFIHEAQDELEAAQAGVDTDVIARAEGKISLMRRARSSNGGMKDLENLWEYIEAHKGALK